MISGPQNRQEFEQKGPRPLEIANFHRLAMPRQDTEDMTCQSAYFAIKARHIQGSERIDLILKALSVQTNPDVLTFALEAARDTDIGVGRLVPIVISLLASPLLLASPNRKANKEYRLAMAANDVLSTWASKGSTEAWFALRDNLALLYWMPKWIESRPKIDKSPQTMNRQLAGEIRALTEAVDLEGVRRFEDWTLKCIKRINRTAGILKPSKYEQELLQSAESDPKVITPKLRKKLDRILFMAMSEHGRLAPLGVGAIESEPYLRPLLARH